MDKRLIMKEYKDVAVTAYTWHEIRDQVANVNPELAGLIDEINPDNNCKLYKARYIYGDHFLKNGELFLPGKEGGLVAFADSLVDTEIKQDLGYNLSTNPVTLVLHNSLEMFMTLEDRIVPFSINHPGDVFGLWRVLDRPQTDKLSHASIFMWDMTAGARSIFMLPKISESMAHNKLKQATRITTDKPRSLIDHWKVFKDIAQQPDFKEPWHTEVLYFSKDWFEKLNDPAWLKLRYDLLNKAWQGTEFWRNQFVWNLTFTRIQTLRKIKASSYIADIVKHILAISTGAIPGFKPATDNSLGPISTIQQAYLDHYDLKDYAPILMQVNQFKAKASVGETPAYYSLQFPTALELSPKTSGRSSAISDLYDIRALIEKYMKQI